MELNCCERQQNKERREKKNMHIFFLLVYNNMFLHLVLPLHSDFASF